MKISFFDPLPNFLFTPTEFSHSHQSFIHTCVTVVSRNDFHMMISHIVSAHRIHTSNPHIEFTYTSSHMPLSRFSVRPHMGAQGERGLGSSGVCGRCCRVFGRCSSGGARRRRRRRRRLRRRRGRRRRLHLRRRRRRRLRRLRCRRRRLRRLRCRRRGFGVGGFSVGGVGGAGASTMFSLRRRVRWKRAEQHSQGL